MMRTAVLLASSLILASCATPFPPDPGPIEQPAAVAVDPRLCAPAEPEPLIVGTIVAPVTEAERVATRDHLTSDAEGRSWGRRGWERSEIARTTLCRPPQPG